MAKKKLLYIISNIDKALEHEWVVSNLKNGFDISFIIINNANKSSHLASFLLNENVPVTEFTYSKKRDLLLVFLKVLFKVIRNKPDIIHAHLFEATLIGLFAGKLAGVKKNIYTRHHSSYHHIYFPSAVKYDRFCNYLATDIVAISSTVKTILKDWENVKEEKIALIPHGLDFNFFQKVTESDIAKIREKYNISNEHIIIGVISRYTEWKGIQYIIPAFKKLLEIFPTAKLILANANMGEYTFEIKKKLKNLPVNSYIEIDFENEIHVLYKLFNIFIHTPIDNHSEAFGQIYIESMASKTPSIFTKSGIGNDLIIDNENCITVDYENSEQIYLGIRRILEDKELKEKIITKAFADVQKYNIENKITLLKKLYNEPD